MITPTVCWGWQNPVCRKQNPGWTRIIPTACTLLVRQWLHQHCADDKTHADQCLYTISVKTTKPMLTSVCTPSVWRQPMLTNVYTPSVWRQQTHADQCLYTISVKTTNPCWAMFIHHQHEDNKIQAGQWWHTGAQTTNSRLDNDHTPPVHRPQTPDWTMTIHHQCADHKLQAKTISYTTTGTVQTIKCWQANDCTGQCSYLVIITQCARLPQTPG